MARLYKSMPVHFRSGTVRACLVVFCCSRLLAQLQGVQAVRGPTNAFLKVSEIRREHSNSRVWPDEGSDSELQPPVGIHNQSLALVAIALRSLRAVSPQFNTTPVSPQPSVSPSPSPSASPSISPSVSPLISPSVSPPPGPISPSPVLLESPSPTPNPSTNPNSPTSTPSPKPPTNPTPSPVYSPSNTPPPAPSPSQRDTSSTSSPSPVTPDDNVDDPSRPGNLLVSNATNGTSNRQSSSSQGGQDQDTWKLVISIVIPSLTGIAAVLTIAYTGWKWWHKRKATIASKRHMASISRLPDVRTFIRDPQPVLPTSYSGGSGYSGGSASGYTPKVGVKPLYPAVRL